MRRDDVALLRERSQVYPSSSPQEQVDHSTAFLADEMIMLAGLGVVSSCLFIQEERADFALLDETVKVAIHRGEADSRQLFVHPPVDLMGKRVAVITLESFEYLCQLTCSTLAGGPSHRLPRILAIERIGSSVSGCGISSRQPPVKWFSGYVSSPASGTQRCPIVRIINPRGSSPPLQDPDQCAPISKTERAAWQHRTSWSVTLPPATPTAPMIVMPSKMTRPPAAGRRRP